MRLARWRRSLSAVKAAWAALPGIRQVRAQVALYAAAWERSNDEAMAGSGPLWVVLGDSTAQGIGAPGPEKGYVGLVAAQLDLRTGRRWRVLNLSRSGARVADVIAKQLPRLEGLTDRPGLVSCAVGANDLVRRTPPDDLVAGLRQVMSTLPEGSVIATLPQGLRPAVAQLANAVICEEAPPAGLTVADVWAATGPPWKGKLAADRFHPGALGYAEWARAFLEAMDARFPAAGT